MNTYVMKRFVLGLLMIAIGIGYIGQVIGVWHFTLFFPGWWTVLIILPALYHMICRGIHFFSVFMMMMGFYFLAEANGWISFELNVAVLAAIICISIGLKLLFTRKGKWYEYGYKD